MSMAAPLLEYPEAACTCPKIKTAGSEEAPVQAGQDILSGPPFGDLVRKMPLT